MSNRQEHLERKLAHIQSLIDRGRPSWLTLFRLNQVARKLEKQNRTRQLDFNPRTPWIFSLILALCVLASAASANSYSTNFPKSENPLSEGGHWINGKATGLDWSNCQAIGGHASGTQVWAGNYNDSTAVLTGSWGPEQSAQATMIAGNSWQNAVEEVELRLRTAISAHNITGYEFDFRDWFPGGYVAIVRWNGPLNSFTTLASDNNNYHGIKTGDVLSATAQGNVLSAYVNGVLVAQASDNTWANGNPGVGFWLSNGGDNADFGLINFSATDGNSTLPPPNPSPTPGPVPYAAWEGLLLNEMGSIGVRNNQLNAISAWMGANPPAP